MKSFILLYSLCMLCNIVFSKKIYNDPIFISEVEASSGIENDIETDSNMNLEMIESNITDEELILFFKDTYLDFRYPPISQNIEEDYMQGWYYLDSYYNDINEMKKYFSAFMDEETFDYLFQIFDYDIYKDRVIHNTESELSNYMVDFERIQGFQVISKNDNLYKIKVPFEYSGLFDVEPRSDFGEVWINQDSSGEWKIVKISQWLNDLIYYEFKDYKYIYFINSQDDFQQFLEKYGKNNKGERISTEIIRNGECILPDSDSRLLTQADLETLTKISAVLAYYEIEARHGYISESRDSFISYELYFDYYCTWYSGNSDKSDLNEIEKNNQEILLNYIESF